MKFGYLFNSYPGTSMTFIRTEITAIETRYGPVPRYAIRRWDGPLVTAEDARERDLTRYVLDAPGKALLRAFVALLRNPAGMARAISSLAELYRAARRRPFAHLAYLVEAATIKAWAEREGVTHLHTHFSTNSAAVAMLCQRMGGPSYSFTAHGPNEFYEDNLPTIPLKAKYATFVACISTFCEARVLDISGPAAAGKTQVVRCGIELDDFNPTPPRGPSAPLICVGRLCPEKAQLVTVEALARIATEHPDLHIQFVGDGEDRAAIEARIAAHGLGDRVSLFGWRSHEEVRRLIGEARALILPSFAEGLPMVLMEALALGRPVVTTPVAGIPELVTQECGWLVEPGDEDGLARALVAVMAASPDEMRSKAVTGRSRVEQLHDGRRNAYALAAFLERAAQAHGRS